MDAPSLYVGTALFAVALVGLYLILVRIVGPRRRLEAMLGYQALRDRLARGEITKEEFDQAKRALGH
jgi:uncharacterized membrane protein